MTKKILLLFLFIPLFGIAQQQINQTMIYDGNAREYTVYIPASYDGSTSYPLLFSFHGGGGTSSDFINTNDMRPIADTAGFIAIYPQAAIDPDDGSFSWLHKAPTTHNDIFFIEAIIDTLSTQYMIDNNRVYACGYSEGGIFSYELGCRLNNRIAAFSSVSGSMLVDAFRDSYYDLGFCSPVHPTAVLLIPGTNDMSPHSTYSGFQPYYMSADEITTYWSNYNNTDINPIISQLPNINTSDGSTVERRVWENGDNCVRVEELKVIGGDHDWPGTWGNMDISASIEVWNFVSKFDINGLIDCNTTSNQEINNFHNKKTLAITDMLGRNTKVLKNIPLFYIYDDGTVEKKIFFE
jgi:polyhydroxybutyrate depolymerase